MDEPARIGAWPETCTRTIRRRRIQWYAGHDKIDTVEVARVLAAHERRDAGIGRFICRAVQVIAGNREITVFFKPS